MVRLNQAIIIASSQHRRQSLAALLRSMPEFNEIYEMESLEQICLDLPENPNLIVFDCWPGENISQETITLVKDSFQNARLLALIRQNNDLMPKLDVDLILTEGFTANFFYDSVRQLITSHP
ncbi:MAG: hypothetical protein LWX83_06555 [Anaerolineae bacterium]|nr:hypothetical protein [Anaerolineae bacterium]